MIVIGLTGGSGSGKTLASNIFAEYGVVTLNADRIYHEILSKKDGCTEELVKAFGNDILDTEGFVARKKLAAAVFGKKDTPELLHTLNKITHTYVMSEIRKRLSELKNTACHAVLLDAPQLFEAGAEKDCDVIVGVVAPRNVRVARIMARDGLSTAAAEARINAQPNDNFYRTNCHVILENDHDEAALRIQIKELLARYSVGEI